jgi:hypothetical protein
MAKERDAAATVISQDGNRLEVDHRGERLTVSMRGFPPGFTLRTGSRVILYQSPSELLARPLVRAVRARARPEEVGGRRGIEVEGRRLEMQDNTIVEERPARPNESPSEDYEVWLVERGHGESPDQVIAVRRRR